VIIGYLTIEPMLFGSFFKDAIHVAPEHEAMADLAEHFHGALAMGVHALQTLPFWLALGGVLVAWFLYLRRPQIPEALARTFAPIYSLLVHKYWLDELYGWLFAGGALKFGAGLWRIGDVKVIDGVIVNGTAHLVGWFAGVIRRFQSGMIYHYAFTMIIGVFVLLTLWFVRI
jgi:NADH-quinone oxidoreductase subunit L